MLKKAVTFILLFVMCFSAAACKKDGGGEKNNAEVDVSVWSAHSTTKVLRDVSYGVSDPAALEYEMCKNETEGAQFIITPNNGYKVKTFDVSVSDLSGSDGAVIKKDAIKIYLQKYINVYENMTGNPKAQTGYHPDALLPFDKAVEYGENTVAGVNQGVYVTVKTEKDTPAGNYSGAVTLTVDGKSYQVPMRVEVWDFAISDEVHVRSLFDIWTSNLIYTELDCSEEMQRAYYNALLDYRVNANRLIYSNLDEYVEEAKKAAADPRVSTYVLPNAGAPCDPAESGGLTSSLDFDYHMKCLRLLAENSTEELCLLDKLAYYPGWLYDEPQFDKTGKMDKQIIYVTQKLETLNAKLISDLEKEGYFDDKSAEYKAHFIKTLNDIPNIVTGPYNDSYVTGLNTYCPLFDEFQSEENRQIYAQERELNGEVWWYGCTGPNYPYITYHIDDNLVGARILNWMMYDYGIDGNLYWCVNYAVYNEESKTGNISRPVNVYEEVRRDARQGAINGDGYLFYPGVDYGIKGPVGTIRLEAVRDGNEEYEYLYELDKLARGVSEYYDTEISANDMVSNLYKRLYSGVKYVPDEENYFAVRRELAQIIGRLGGDDKFVAGEISYDGANAELTFYAADGYTAKVNGESVEGAAQGSGKKYVYSISLDKSSNYFRIELEKDGATKNYEIFVGGKTTVVTDFDSEEKTEAVHKNDNAITVSYSTDKSVSGGAAKVEIVSKFNPQNPLATLTYTPQITFKASELGFTIKDVEKFTLMVYNDSENDITTTIYLSAPNGTYQLTTQKLVKGKWTAVTLDNLYLTGWRHLGTADSIVFAFDNTVGGENKVAMFDQIIYMDNMLVSAVAAE